MRKFLVVVDMQNDFISGALGTKEAQAIVENVKNKIRGFDGEVLFTRDTHYENYLETQEGKNLPIKHCIKDTWGWEIEKSIDELRDGMAINKVTFGSSSLFNMLESENARAKIDEITFEDNSAGIKHYHCMDTVIAKRRCQSTYKFEFDVNGTYYCKKQNYAKYGYDMMVNGSDYNLIIRKNRKNCS